jgi:diguanylate cyclase
MACRCSSNTCRRFDALKERCSLGVRFAQARSLEAGDAIMTEPPSLPARWLAARKAENDLVAEQAQRENLSRIRWVSWVVWPLGLASAVLFWSEGDPAGQADASLWHLRVAMTFAALSGVLPVLGWLAWRAAAPSASSGFTRLVNWLAFATMLGFTIAFVTIDQLITPSVTPFVIGSAFAGVVLLIRPLPATLMYGLAYGAFYVCMGQAQADPNRLLSNRADGLAAVVLGLLVAVILWRKNTVNVLLQNELERHRNALQEQQQQSAYLAAHDGLTGLFNRREFNRLAELEVARALRYGTETCVIVLDLDHFKSINDTHGHPVGDRVLRHIAALLAGAVRATDLVGRLGGEEFIVLLSHTGPASAQGLAEKLRRLLEATPLEVSGGNPIHITASLGVAALRNDERGSLTHLYTEADQALYEAKAAGRNQVAMYADKPSTAGGPTQQNRLLPRQSAAPDPRNPR